MYDIYVNELKVFSDFIVYEPKSKKLIMANLLERSKYTVQSVIANIYNSSNFFISSDETLSTYGSYTGYIQGFSVGKSRYFQGIIKSDLIYNKNSAISDSQLAVCIISNENQSKEDTLFDALYEMHDLPLERKWKDYLYSELEHLGKISKCKVLKSEDFSYKIKEGNIATDLANWSFHLLRVSPSDLDMIVSQGIKNGIINVSNTPQKAITVKSIDDYFMKYGDKVIENVMKSLKPKLPRIGKIPYTAKQKIPFPVQAEVINGIVNHLKVMDYIIVNGGMGVGKSFISSVSVAMSQLNSRTLVMGPGHMLEKWHDEIADEIHGAKVKIIKDFEDVTSLLDLKGTEPVGQEFYLFSKDFAKLSYETTPIVSKHMNHTVPLKRCGCGQLYFDSFEHKQCSCGSTEFSKVRSRYKVRGATCPDCAEVVLPPNAKFESMSNRREGDTEPVFLTDFSNPTNKNSVCGHCGTKLWQPNVKNLSLANEYSNIQKKNERWIKIKIPRNKSNRTFKTEYMLKKSYEENVTSGYLNNENHSLVKLIKMRRYSPAKYIKKVLGKNFFDFAIFDEAHLFKSGDSAQGNAFGQLIKASKKSLILTGTLAGGVAVDLFYLLYRLDSRLMLENGYSYKDVMKFAADYGVVEETKSYENETVYLNKTSNGRSVGSKKILPGISPLVFSKLLINNTIFLDLADFDAFLPVLNEFPVPVEMTSKQRGLYNKVQDSFKSEIRQEGGKKLLGQFLPTLLSLPDVNELSPIIHPEFGHEIFSFKEPAKSFHGVDGLLSKERELVKIVEKELGEGRNCFIYAEFTSDGEKNITERLKSILEERLDLKNQVAVLKSSSPKAIQRMSWIKEKAAEGVKVFITNPKNVETGLDFIFKHKGRVYNYPTIVFYQLGFNLFTAWQASARHRRLIQTESCRTYYLFYEDTLQSVALETLANKKAATAALQGTFSEEGLIAMANSVDPRVLLANALMNGAQKSNLDALFDKINERRDLELTDEDKELMEKILRNFKNGDLTDRNQSVQLSFTDIEDFISSINFLAVEKTIGKGKSRAIEGQLKLF